MYLEASGLLPNDMARIISPKLPRDNRKKCLTFKYNVHGVYVGNIQIVDSFANYLWRWDGVAGTRKFEGFTVIARKVNGAKIFEVHKLTCTVISPSKLAR